MSLALSGKDYGTYDELRIEVPTRDTRVPLDSPQLRASNPGTPTKQNRYKQLKETPLSRLDSPPCLWFPTGMNTYELLQDKRWESFKHDDTDSNSVEDTVIPVAGSEVQPLALRAEHLDATKYVEEILMGRKNNLFMHIKKADLTRENLNGMTDEGTREMVYSLSQISFYWNSYKEVPGFQTAFKSEFADVLTILGYKIMVGKNTSPTPPLQSTVMRKENQENDENQIDIWKELEMSPVQTETPNCHSPIPKEWLKELRVILHVNEEPSASPLARMPSSDDLTAIQSAIQLLEELIK